MFLVNLNAYHVDSATAAIVYLFMGFTESCTQIAEAEIRKCSAFLESELLSGNGGLPLTEWGTVPDIWRTSAEKFGDRVAVVDPYHDPPTTMTYKQVTFSFLILFLVISFFGIKLKYLTVCVYFFIV